MNNAMLAKEWRKAPLTRTTDLASDPEKVVEINR
jgi:hypothetical protein